MLIFLLKVKVLILTKNEKMHEYKYSHSVIPDKDNERIKKTNLGTIREKNFHTKLLTENRIARKSKEL